MRLDSDIITGRRSQDSGVAFDGEYWRSDMDRWRQRARPLRQVLSVHARIRLHEVCTHCTGGHPDERNPR